MLTGEDTVSALLAVWEVSSCLPQGTSASVAISAVAKHSLGCFCFFGGARGSEASPLNREGERMSSVVAVRI